MKILSIETSCDETTAAVLEFKSGGFSLFSNVVASSVELQAKYGGIVPEVAARKQMEFIMPVIEEALEKAKANEENIDYIAVVNGPGLVTSLRVGVEAGKGLAYAWNKPLVQVNHLEGHFYSVLLGDKKKRINFPALGLIVSGGHTELVLVKNHLKYKLIGRTLDDAVGEAFDKVAKILGLGYPGGPAISKMALRGDREKIEMPRPMINSADFNFSFSGIKTSVLYKARNKKKLDKRFVNDMCASFQEACVDVLTKKTLKAARKFDVKSVILGGGVAANGRLRERLGEVFIDENIQLLIPEMKFTGDNAAMMGIVAYHKIKKKKFVKIYGIKVDPNLRLG